MDLFCAQGALRGLPGEAEGTAVPSAGRTVCGASADSWPGSGGGYTAQL